MKRSFVYVLVLIVMLSGMSVTAQSPCGDAPAPRLVVGERGLVTNTATPTAVNVRSAATRTASVVGQIPEGAAFDVLNGPICADNINWWHVSADDGTIGWMAEGTGGEYFVEPLASAPVDVGTCAEPRLVEDSYGSVIPGKTASAYYKEGDVSQKAADLTGDEPFKILDGPICIDGVNWLRADTLSGWLWLPETVNGEYVIEPYHFVPATPVPIDVPMTPPQISTLNVPLPPVVPTGSPDAVSSWYATWDWAAIIGEAYYRPPDPMTLQLPAAYAGDLPVPPVDLSTVRFVQDANLNPQQLALLAQNGFVVVPAGITQFDEVYRRGWPANEGKAGFVTTDALLHSLYLTYQNALMFLEMGSFYRQTTQFVGAGYQAAEAQMHQAAGTPLEAPARSTAVYYAVALSLLADGQMMAQSLYEKPALSENDLLPTRVLAAADPSIVEMAQPIVEMIRAAQGRLAVPILEQYEEDFSQYKVRGYYAGDPVLESYFRAMMWLGRITFLAKSEADTLSALMVLRALQNAGEAYDDWKSMADTLTFLVGPMDDFGPPDYAPLAESVFGAGLPLDTLADPDRLAAFRAEVAKLPGPRVNSIPLPVGVEADQVDGLTRGFRLFGQRFTFDAYVMQQLIYPEVGTREQSRVLPLGLDVAAALGSDMAYVLADAAGATAYANYTDNMAKLRTEVNGLGGSDWMQNLYGGWLWALQPLLVRDPALIPPMMKTDAWQRKDIHTTLGSWTELKHATLLYAEQAMGGLGGGGMLPPVISHGYVEPNPQVFSRIAIVAASLRQGLRDRHFLERVTFLGLYGVDDALLNLSVLSAQLAEMARKEVAGEPLTYDELYFLQENFDSALWYIRYVIETWVTDPPETVALVADVASNASAGLVLEAAIGDIDLIYVVTNSPDGLQLTRGGVYSYYEFIQNIDSRLTDDDWRSMVAAGTVPPRPTWVDLYFSD